MVFPTFHLNSAPASFYRYHGEPGLIWSPFLRLILFTRCMLFWMFPTRWRLKSSWHFHTSVAFSLVWGESLHVSDVPYHEVSTTIYPIVCMNPQSWGYWLLIRCHREGWLTGRHFIWLLKWCVINSEQRERHSGLCSVFWCVSKEFGVEMWPQAPSAKERFS